MSAPLLHLQGVGHAFEDLSVLSGVELELHPGAHALIEGPSGAGKTTLLNIAGALLRPSSGTVLFDGERLSDVGNRARHRLHNVGFVFQEFHLLESLSARQNLDLIQTARGGEPARAIEELLGPLGLEGRIDTAVKKLSRGERQRVALARAFANGPRLVLADEPTASLDPSRATATLDHLFHLAEATGATVLVVSHDPALKARDDFSQQLVLEDGRLRGH